MYGNPTLGHWVRLRRSALGLTQAVLAEQIACSLSLVRKIERGERRAPPELLPRLLALLGASLAEQAAFLPGAPALTPPRRRPGAVPAAPNRLIGRTTALTAIRRRLIDEGVRLLTLVGPPGIGKTRLAQQAASDLLPLFDQQVYYVALAPLSAAEELPAALAAALGLHLHFNAPLIEQISDALYARRSLLVLDNFEHLAAAAPLSAVLLEGCPQLQILVTSREPLRLRAEQSFPVAPLALPAEAQPAEAARSAAVRLFADRARAYDPDFRLDRERLPAVLAICRRLDGLPLAIELAAARLDQAGPAALLARLDPALPMLVEGPRDLPARQRTLREAIRWSYHLLNGAEQQLFACLGVFVGGCDEAAALALSMGSPAHLARLVEASLVQQDGPRLALLATLREFALEQLDAAGVHVLWQGRHAAYFADLAEQAQAHLAGPAAAEWLDRLDQDLPNLRAAIAWSLANEGGICAARIAAALLPFWRTRGYFDDLRPLEALLLAGAPALAIALRARALYVVGFLASQQSDPRCYRLLDAAVPLFTAVGDEYGAVRCLNLQGLLARVPGSYARSVDLHRQALARSASLNNPDLHGSVLNNLGMALAYQANYPAAVACYREALRLAEAQGNPMRSAERQPNLAETLLLQGRLAEARCHYQETLALARAIGHREVLAECLDGLGRIMALQGDLATAADQFAASLAIYGELGLLFAIVRVRRNQGYLALHQDDPSAAAAHFQAALSHTILPNLGDIAAHCLAGLARITQLRGASNLAARMASCVEGMYASFGLRNEPEQVTLRTLLAPLAVSEPVAWAQGRTTPPAAMITLAQDMLH